MVGGSIKGGGGVFYCVFETRFISQFFLGGLIKYSPILFTLSLSNSYHFLVLQFASVSYRILSSIFSFLFLYVEGLCGKYF